VEGKFVDSDGNKSEGQYVLLYLLRRCYGTMYKADFAAAPATHRAQRVIAVQLHCTEFCIMSLPSFGLPGPGPCPLQS